MEHEDVKSKSLYDCIARSRAAYVTLNEATADCEAKVDAEIALFQKDSELPVTAVEKKNIKKIAKALASEKVNSLKNEARSLARMVADLFGKEDSEEVSA